MQTETKARAGTGVSEGPDPAAEVKTALAGFLKEVKGFQDEMKSKMQQQEELLEAGGRGMGCFHG